MNITARNLITLERCEKKYELNRINMVTEKNKNYYISIATKGIIKFFLQSSKARRLSLNTLEDELENLLPDKAFLPLVKKEVVKELAEQLKRYLEYIESNNYKLIKSDIVQDIKINGQLITVSADFVFENLKGIEIVKIKRKAPDLSYQARKLENMPKNNIELYLLYLLGEQMYPGKNILASFHHMSGKRDKKSINSDYDAKKGYNIISFDFSKNKDTVESKLLELINKTKLNKFEKTTHIDNCKVCPYVRICNYKTSNNKELEEITEINKAPSDFALTDSQEKAVNFQEGIARINAGAGSGKTTVVALRVTKLIIAGCKPEDILLITFTNKGANEMKDKIAYWLKKEKMNIDLNKLNITTFNAWGDGIIKENFNELGFSEPPELIDKVQKYDIIFELLEKNPKMEGFDYKNPLMNFKYATGAVSELNNLFNYMKSHNAINPEKLTKKIEKSEIYKVLDIYKQYNKTLIERNLIEYQDQINLLIRLINEKNEVMNKYNYKHIIVDEFQDSDSMQIDLIKFLTNQTKFKSLMVVGDDSQCQPAGTKVSMPNGDLVNIEDLNVGDKVLSCSVPRGYYPKSPEGTKMIKNISTHTVDTLISIETENGKMSRYTPNHRCFARIHYEGNEDKSVVYLMENEKGHFRVGQTKLFVKGTRDFGVRYRMNQEGAINAWILKVCDASEAWVAEQICSFKYGIPQTTWTGNSTVTISDIEKLYDIIGIENLREKAAKCLKYFGRNINYPLIEKDKNKHFSKQHITELRACNLMPEIMDVAVPKLKERRWRNSYEQLKSIDTVYDSDGFVVYGLDVEDYETYVADGILTHNSIFGFRNTSQENILNFHKIFDDVKDIKIVENFRSTPEIISLANALNNYNKNKIEKELISGAEHGDKPILVSFNNKEMEYEFITKKTKELMQEYNPEDIAIIARTRYELFDIAENLDEANIPYIMDIPEPLLNNINIRIAKSLITFLNNPEINQGLFEYLFVITNGFKGFEQNEAKEFVKEELDLIKEIIVDIGEGVKLDLFFTMVDLIEDEFLNQFMEELKEKDYTFNELKDYLCKFIEYEDNKTIEKAEKKYKAITLTTAHTSKGKEFPVVFNTISKYSAKRTLKSIEEERRTLFVSITRAKEKLIITYDVSNSGNFNKRYKAFPQELANTGKCFVGRGVKKENIA